MPFAAFDIHLKSVEAVLTDDAGAILLRRNFPATREAILEFARRHLSREHRVALEATFHTWAIAALLEPFVAEVVVSNPLRTRAIAEAKIKTDRVDATVLVHLLRLDYLPRVWQPDPATRDLRRATTERANLVADRTRLKNRIHAVLHQRLLVPPKGDLFSPANLRWLGQLELDPAARESLDRHLRQLAYLETEIADQKSTLARQAYADSRVKLLMTLPGVDFTVAQSLLAAWGEVRRFPSAEKAAAYLGLVPSTHQSADHCYHGPITKQGRAHSRWLLVQAAQHLDRHPGPLGVFFRRIARKKNRNVAVVATAHKLALIAWYMLRHDQPYRYAQPRTVEAKFTRLRVGVTGQRKRTGSPKGSPQPATRGTGVRTRAVPALDEIYAGEGLPPLMPLPAGERRMLDQTGTAQHAQTIRHRTRVPRKPAPPPVQG
jgi:transposase